MESCTPERRKALEQRLRHSSRWARKAETDIAQALADAQVGVPVKRVTGFTIAGVLPVLNATDELDVIVRTEGYITYVFRLKRIDSEWKVHQ